MEEDSLNCEIPQKPTGFHGRPRDLLRRLSTEIHRFESPPEESSEIELSLGLSLGGRFGVDPIEKNRLIRSSSIGGLATILSYEDLRTAFPPASPLPRTVSLPAETEENRRKRKEVQSLRRLEAKKKRSDKQRNSNGRSAGIEEEKGKGFPADSNGFSAAGLVGGSLQGLNMDSRNGKSVGSVGSQGSSSSGVSDLENLSAQGMSNYTEARSPTSVQSLLPERVNQNPTGGASQKPGKVGGGGEEVEKKNPRKGRNMMEEMPCVSTRGCGPNGRRVEGFLYKFRKGEEVRIVCVCHGNFLSPAEFVKHAGGGDVLHPLKHIVVNSSSSFL